MAVIILHANTRELWWRHRQTERVVVCMCVCVGGVYGLWHRCVHTPAALPPPPTHASSHDDHHRLMAASTRNLHFRRTTRAKGSRRKRRSVDRWYFRISFSARVPGLYRLGFLALPPAPPTTRRGLACFLPLFGVPLRAEAPPTRVLPVGYFVRAIAPRRAGPARAVQARSKAPVLRRCAFLIESVV